MSISSVSKEKRHQYKQSSGKLYLILKLRTLSYLPQIMVDLGGGQDGPIEHGFSDSVFILPAVVVVSLSGI